MLKNIDTKLLKKFGIIIGSIVTIFIIVIIIMILVGNKKSYSEIETIMINSAKNYYTYHKDELPKEDNETVTISTDKLVENKYMKELDKLSKTSNCSGQVTVTKSGTSNDNSLLYYSSTLTCGEDYKTKKLKDVIASNVVEKSNGLYKMGDEYIYRGDKVNNFVNFADKTWMIVKINADGSIRLIETTRRDSVAWDDRYNSDKEYNIGINDYTVSRLRETVDSLIEEFTDNNLSYIVKQDVCFGKRSVDDNINDGSIECSQKINKQYFGLLQVNEFALASLSELCDSPTDPECTNYNYLNDFRSFWSVTADKDTSYKVYKFSNGPFVTNASSSAQPRLVININSNVNYVSGDGTEENPYTFK